MANARDITRRTFLAASCGALASCASTGPARTASQSRPNIVFLLTDDQRWDALGCAGNSIVRTPNLDALAARGTRFTNTFATTAICAASRASILTGMYTRTHGIDVFDAPLPEPLFAQTYPMVLRGAGYHTGFVGKWGVGGDLPESAFDYFDGFPGQGNYFQEIDGQTVHLTGLLGDKAVRFLENSPEEQPFCLSVSFKAPHVQDEDPRQYLYDPALEDLYADVTIPEPPTGDAAFFDASPEFIRVSEGRERWKKRFATPEQYQASVKGYYRLVTGVDIAVGRIVQALEDNGLAENTVIVFTSDQGVFNGERGLADKWLMHEPSIRMPLIIFDPRIERQRTTLRHEMALNIDLAPTLLDFAGLPIPNTMQGRSLRPLVYGEEPEWRDEWFYAHHFGTDMPAPIPASEGVRTDRWKYIRYVDTEPLYEELYDLQADPFETLNLITAPEHATRAQTLRWRWQIWRAILQPWEEYRGTVWHDPE